MENSKNYPPEMHTAEHILNQTMIRLFACDRSFNNHIEKKKSKCDYHFDRALSDVDVQSIETKVNEIISANMLVTEEIYERLEAEKLITLNRLPEDAGDLVRIIKVGDYDKCPCSGNHVKTTGEIGVFQIISTSFEDGVLRIRFKVK